MKKIIYRKSTYQDISKISCQIAVSYKAAYKRLMTDEYLASLSSDHWVPILQNTASAGGTCLVAVCEDGIIGSAVFGKSNIEPFIDHAELFAIYLLPNFVGCGVGHNLYNEVEKEMIARKFTGCVLEVLSENYHAIKFYTSHGFEAIRSFTIDENGMTLPCLVMRKNYLFLDLSMPVM